MSLIEKMSDISKSSYRKNISQSTEFIKYFNLSTDTRLVAKGQYNDFVVYHNNSFYCMH